MPTTIPSADRAPLKKNVRVNLRTTTAPNVRDLGEGKKHLNFFYLNFLET